MESGTDKISHLVEKQLTPLDEKKGYNADVESTDDVESEFGVLHNERDIATHVISLYDDPSLSPWTLRAFIIGIGLSAFGGVLGAINSVPLPKLIDHLSS